MIFLSSFVFMPRPHAPKPHHPRPTHVKKHPHFVKKHPRTVKKRPHFVRHHPHFVKHHPHFVKHFHSSIQALDKISSDLEVNGFFELANELDKFSLDLLSAISFHVERDIQNFGTIVKISFDEVQYSYWLPYERFEDVDRKAKKSKKNPGAFANWIKKKAPKYYQGSSTNVEEFKENPDYVK